VTRDRQVVAGLDLGSTKTCAVIAEVVGDLPRVPLAKVLGVGLAKNAGVRRGMVRDIDETSRSIVAALRDAERMAGVKVGAVTCGIAGEHVSARTSTGVVAVSGDEITAEDVARVNEVARAVSLGRDHELLHDIPQEYVVDQQRGISDPVGMTGTRLEVEMYLVTVQSTAAQNLRKSVERARYRVGDLVLEPLAASYAVLTDDERELGVALVEVGGGSTGVAIFHEGKIRHLASIKFAGTHVTSDMMQGLGVTQADAERLKEAAGVARAGVAHHPPAGGRDFSAGAARVRAGGVRGRPVAGRRGADGWDGASAGDGGAGARGVRGAGAGREPRAGDLGTGRQRAGAALRGAGRAGAVRGAAARAGRRARRLAGQECGGRQAVRTAEAVVAGLLLIGHPREP